MRHHIADAFFILAAPFIFVAVERSADMSVAVPALGGYSLLLAIYFIWSHKHLRRGLSKQKVTEYVAFSVLVLFLYLSLL